jgi:hypothetical protein
MPYQDREPDPPALALWLIVAGWLLFLAFQTVVQTRELSSLLTLHANQEQTVVNAQRMREQLDALAAGTRRLADGGNRNAQAMVEELARRGVTIKAAP